MVDVESLPVACTIKGKRALSNMKKIVLPRIPDVPNLMAVCCQRSWRKLFPPQPVLTAARGALARNAAFIMMSGERGGGWLSEY